MNRTASLLAVLLAAGAAFAGEEDFYRIETIPVPPHVVLEVGGMAFMPDGRLMIATRYGEIWSLRGGEWKRFAEGLHEPMGIVPTGPHEVVVAQRPELTRITDSNGDGVADVFETLTDAWNYSGHEYEWTFGPVRDRDGNLWAALACWHYASNPSYGGAPYSGWAARPVGEPGGADARWRGWSFKLTPRGEFVPWSCGLRSPNGLALSPGGELFVTDNQGEYLGSCVLHHVTRGAFHGHPAGLEWGENATADPFRIPIEELDQRRKLPAIVFPYGAMGQSASQPLFDTSGGKFGPFAGQLFVGDQTHSTVMRVALEKVGGEFQGACFPFRRGFQGGNNRLAFAPDGSLFVGQTQRGWGSVGSTPFGLQRLTWTGAIPFEIHSMNLTRDGFDLHFTKPVAVEAVRDPAAWTLRHFHYHYHRHYGSPRVDETPVPVREVRISPDARTVSLALGEMLPRKIYELHATGIGAADGSKLLHPEAYYTLNRLQSQTVIVHE